MKLTVFAIVSAIALLVLTSCIKPELLIGKFTDQLNTYEFRDDGSVLYFKNTKPQFPEKGKFRCMGSTVSLTMDDGRKYALLVVKDGAQLLYSEGGRGDVFERISSEK